MFNCKEQGRSKDLQPMSCKSKTNYIGFYHAGISINILSPVGYNPNDINISNSVHLCDKNRYHPDEVFFKKKNTESYQYHQLHLVKEILDVYLKT